MYVPRDRSLRNSALSHIYICRIILATNAKYFHKPAGFSNEGRLSSLFMIRHLGVYINKKCPDLVFHIKDS
jgi:hypothetical protein